MTLASKFTVARIILSPFMVIFAAIGFPHWNEWAFGVFVITALTDTIDGNIARRFNQISDFGKLVDPIADKLMTTSAMLTLVAWGKLPAYIAMILITRDIAVSAMRITAASHSLVVSARNSGKIKTLLQIIAYGAYFLEFDKIGLFVMIAAVIMTVWSMVDYLYANKHVISGKMTMPFVMSFIDKLIVAYLIFVLVGMGKLPAWIGMLFISKDHAISGIRVMAIVNGKRMETQLSEILSFLTQFALWIMLLFGVELSSFVGIALLIVSILVSFYSLFKVIKISK